MADPYSSQDSSMEISMRIRDIEERQRMLRDRIVLIGETLMKDREHLINDMQEFRKTLLILQSDSDKMKSQLNRATELLSTTARKEELAILQRQFDLFRGD